MGHQYAIRHVSATIKYSSDVKYDYFGPKALNRNKAVNPSTLSRLMQMVHFWPIKRFGKGHKTVYHELLYIALSMHYTKQDCHPSPTRDVALKFEDFSILR